MDYKRILVFGAHPDDELTMAGTMAKLAGDGVHVAICTPTNGSEGFPRPEMKDSIVAVRAKEMAEADKVLGASERICIGAEDMGLTNDKATFKEFIRVIRAVRPDVVFTHGPHDMHRDHLATHAISKEAYWQAGQPVSTDLGEPWRAPYLIYYKGVADRQPDIVLDVTGFAHIRVLARATQVSQYTLWGRTREDFEREAEQIRNSPGPHTETFWFSERMHLSYLPPLAL